MKASEIRNRFLRFFEGKKHLIVPSAPMVAKDDPTLMFTNAGMNQFKEYFLGNGTPKNVRIADTQKCLRVSGKHNDLEEVGYDTYHHTMFEMLGNWSFGDYFKKEAIAWAWELLTKELGVSEDILYVTVFEGDEKDGLAVDQEAFDFWKQHIPEDRILMGNKKDNFWEMGDQGPCGPCSEIHVDIRSAEEKKKMDGKLLVNNDHPQVVEIWNLVFMQYNRKADGSLESLPAKHIDTGMGFERLCMVLQGKKSNYDTDVFTPLIFELENITHKKYGIDKSVDVAIRVIVDHVRAVAFSIADGQLPSNTGAGYVIRRILRRAIRYGFTFLDQKSPFICKLVDCLSTEMGKAFPELKAQSELIFQVIKEEENSFLHTLEQGLFMLDRLLVSSESKLISGVKAFELYDTYGFPLDLTQLIAREKGFEIDEKDFEVAMQQQKMRSRNAAAVETDDWVMLSDNDPGKFVGYDTLATDVKIIRYRKVNSAKSGVQYHLIFDHTPFYAESGGQIGDRGFIVSESDERIQIIDTKKENNLIIHIAKQLPVHATGVFKAVVDVDARRLTEYNHSATHLLHQALRTILGTHVEQKGSLVTPDYLRFDFSHFAKMTMEQIVEVERFVNQRIREKLPLVEQRQVPIQEAVNQGAMALFGEKYGDEVRIIRFGTSIELCGGTHTANTGDIWSFKIRSEGAIAAGIRRIEAITNLQVEKYFEGIEEDLTAVKLQLKNPKNPAKAVEQLQEENKSLRKEIERFQAKQVHYLKRELLSKVQQVNGIDFLAISLAEEASLIKDIAFAMRKENSNMVFVVGTMTPDGKAIITVAISDDLVSGKSLHAGKMVSLLAKNIQGGGGGQPFYASAGGKNPSGIDQALQQAKAMIEEM